MLQKIILQLAETQYYCCIITIINIRKTGYAGRGEFDELFIFHLVYVIY